MSAVVTIIRKTEAGAQPLYDIPVTTSLSWDYPHGSFYNNLFGIELTLDQNNGRLTIGVDHNYYPDTILIESHIDSAYETHKARTKVLPAPLFSVGDICYETSSWTGEDISYISSAYSYINSTDQTRKFKVCSAGQILASSLGYFRPWDVELSEIISESLDLHVPLLTYDPSAWRPVVTDKMIPHTMTPQDIGAPYLRATEDLEVDVPPGAACAVKIFIKACNYGFDYSMTATSPDGKASIPIMGRYWQRTPLDYYIRTEISDQ